MPDARAVILGKIRDQLVAAASTPAEAYDAVARRYQQAGQQAEPARIRLLLDRLADYDAEVITLTASELSAAVAAVLKRHNESVLLVPATLPASWLPVGIEILRDGRGPDDLLSTAMLTRAQAVLTPCACAIAETGTILLRHGPEQGRRVLTLLPDHHLCVLRADQIVETVSEGLAMLAADRLQAITTISGPSATADIEMIRIRGVHGPRRLTVLLLSSQPANELA